jgi:hypothetical protein
MDDYIGSLWTTEYHSNFTILPHSSRYVWSNEAEAEDNFGKAVHACIAQPASVASLHAFQTYYPPPSLPQLEVKGSLRLLVASRLIIKHGRWDILLWLAGLPNHRNWWELYPEKSWLLVSCAKHNQIGMFAWIYDRYCRTLAADQMGPAYEVVGALFRGRDHARFELFDWAVTRIPLVSWVRLCELGSHRVARLGRVMYRRSWRRERTLIYHMLFELPEYIAYVGERLRRRLV